MASSVTCSSHYSTCGNSVAKLICVWVTAVPRAAAAVGYLPSGTASSTLCCVLASAATAITTDGARTRHGMPSVNIPLLCSEGCSPSAVTCLCLVCWLQGDAGQLIVDISAKEQADILVLGECVGLQTALLCDSRTAASCMPEAMAKCWP
jgi:hypothetical protein